ncbi:MAG: DUF1223 domain-containing protein [Rhodobacteraceae bacterium]|nr:DUF1223 domain-containing protein [Paracoccaceae bacterium]
MNVLYAVFVSLISLGSAVASAQSNPVVVELFTSQGCSSCPPADRFMHDLAKREDVIALALHVDYWDYIGWKDEFADPAYARRQKGYARVAGHRMVSTPQMIVNGSDDVVGARSMELAELIMTHKMQPDHARIRGVITEQTARIVAEPIAPLQASPLDVLLVRYDPERTVRIKSGENAGREIRYVNTVREWTVIGQWDGVAPTEMNVPITGDRPTVVLVQVRKPSGPGPIVAAAKLE